MHLETHIRPAQSKDVPAIYQMASDLAKHQDLLHRFCVTKASLLEMVTNPNEQTITIVAEADGEVVAFGMYTLLKNNRLYHPGFAMYIDELYVEPTYREQGIGMKMFKYIGKQALAANCNRLEWWVTKGNTGAEQFYAKMAARPLDEFVTYRLQEPDLTIFAQE